ncbi:MAG: HNH endonuclease, partial [Bacteroidales bacterium]|nr:HNH endonuclease [Bacteroidales bacterium]
MRHINKGCEPEYLTEHKDKWLEAFLTNNKPRPDSKKYAHPKIVDALWSASNGKCFYCECSLDDKSKEVDHFIEVAERKDLAFDWNNLNLSCDQCNNKRPNKDIPVDKVLDPC